MKITTASLKSSIRCWFPETPSIKSIWSFLNYQHIESKTWTWWNMSNWNMYLIWNAPKNASKKTRMTSHKEGENYRISWIGGNTVPTIRFLLLKEAFLRVNAWKKKIEKRKFLVKSDLIFTIFSCFISQFANRLGTSNTNGERTPYYKKGCMNS